MCMMLLANQIIQQQKRNKENIILSIERVIHIILFLLANGYFCRGSNISDIFCDYNLFPVVHSTFWFSFHSIFLSSALSLSLSLSVSISFHLLLLNDSMSGTAINIYYCRFEKNRKEEKRPYEIIIQKMVQNADKRLVNGKK